MPVSLVFADSFAHYNNSALKWSTGGGVSETNLAHVRTGPRSLRIQSGNAPSITNIAYPINTGAYVTTAGVFPFIATYSKFVVGTAWQTSVLSGETIFELWAYVDTIGGIPLAPPQRQFQLVQNANGSISIFTGNIPVLIGTTAAGVLTVGPFWYIELTVDMLAATLSLTVTNAANASIIALTAAGFTTSQDHIDRFFWGGPTGGNSAWVADFYFAEWDGIAPGLLGAPKIYGVSVPNADGVASVSGGPPPPFNVTAAPYFPQVNSIPQNTGLFIARESDGSNLFAFSPSQGFQFDVSSVGAGAVAALQVSILFSLDHDAFGNVPGPQAFMGFTGDSGNFNGSGLKQGLVDSPFLFYCFPFDQNPQTVAPWTVAQFTGPTAFQIGPGFGQAG